MEMLNFFTMVIIDTVIIITVDFVAENIDSKFFENVSLVIKQKLELSVMEDNKNESSSINNH
jgi:hypothetical protein